MYLDEEIRQGLRAVSRRLGRAQAELIREALSQYLDRQDEQPLPSFVGSIEVGGNAGAERQSRRTAYVEELDRRKGGGG